MNKRKIVAVGISGGIDSAMSAKLLLDEGYEVIGLTMSIWDEKVPIKQTIKSGCFGPGEADDIAFAKRICAKLGIKHHIIELQKEYKNSVLDYFCSTYLSGKTPNPCVVCNQQIKFGLLPRRAKELGINFDYFATGHYVRLEYHKESERFRLFKAKDQTKDQSYFLSFLRQDQLSNLIFPMGSLTKQEVRKLAQQYGFEELTYKKESQDFLETNDYGVLFSENTFRQGDIKDVEGKILGKHRGLIHYTIGQRKNLGIAGQKEPYYVLKIDNKTNTLIVGPKKGLYQDKLTAVKINWISIHPRSREFEAEAKIRLQHEAAPCIVRLMDSQTAEIIFYQPQLSITPGQIVVIYEGEMVLAGGIIE